MQEICLEEGSSSLAADKTTLAALSAMIFPNGRPALRDRNLSQMWITQAFFLGREWAKEGWKVTKDHSDPHHNYAKIHVYVLCGERSWEPTSVDQPQVLVLSLPSWVTSKKSLHFPKSWHLHLFNQGTELSDFRISFWLWDCDHQ